MDGFLGLVLVLVAAFLVACAVEAGKDREYPAALFFALISAPAVYGVGYFWGWWA